MRPENNPFCNSGLLSMAKVMAQSTIPYGKAILNTVDTGGFVDKRRRMAVVRDVAEGPETLAGQRMASEFDWKERRAVKNVRLYSKVFFHLAFFHPPFSLSENDAQNGLSGRAFGPTGHT